MKTYTEFINEEVKEIPEEVQTFMDNAKENFYKHFPNGIIGLRYKLGLGSVYHISCNLGMIGNTKDNRNGLHDNDNMKHNFIMFQDKKDADIWEFNAGYGVIYLNPPLGSHLAMGSVKTKMGNNKKITLEKAETKLKKWFGKLSVLMQENKDDLFKVQDIDKKYLIFK